KKIPAEAAEQRFIVSKTPPLRDIPLRSMVRVNHGAADYLVRNFIFGDKGLDERLFSLLNLLKLKADFIGIEKFLQCRIGRRSLRWVPIFVRHDIYGLQAAKSRLYRWIGRSCAPIWPAESEVEISSHGAKYL